MIHNDDIRRFKQKCATDTGFAARYLFEFNYDQGLAEDGVTITEVNRPNGGIRRDGPHKDMTEFLDAPGSQKLLLAPRGSYKSTILTSYVARQLLRDRDTTVLYCMKTESGAKFKLRDIRRLLELEKVKDVYGNVRGKKWSNTEIFVSGRSHNVSETAPNVMAAGVGQALAGTHFRIIILDDVVDWDNVRNSEQIDKTLDFFRMVQPLLDPGGLLIVCGTRYVDQDLYGHIIRELDFDVMHISCGMKVSRDDFGKWSLYGEPTFAHLDERHLQNKFDSMDNPSDFVSQYMNEIMSSAEQLFTREMFQWHPRWEPWMGDTAGYILADTAVSTSKTACYTAINLVGLDYRDHAYLLDLAVGRMKPYEVVNALVDMYERWSSKLHIRGILMENITLNETYRAMIVEECRRRQLNPNLVGIPRGRTDEAKDRRIERLHGRFSNGRFHVVGTIPKTFNDLGKRLLLWDPEGWTDEESLFPRPDGELVKEFVFWPRYGKKDIADALADIDATDPIGKRYCSPAARNAYTEDRRRVPGDGIPLAPVLMNVNGFHRVVDAAAQPQGDDWWAAASAQIRNQPRQSPW